MHKSDCLETLEQYGFSNLTETFLTIDANKDKIISKKEGEDAAITMMEDFDRTAQQVCQDNNCMDWCKMVCLNWKQKYAAKEGSWKGGKPSGPVTSVSCTKHTGEERVRCHNCRSCWLDCSQFTRGYYMGMKAMIPNRDISYDCFVPPEIDPYDHGGHFNY